MERTLAKLEQSIKDGNFYDAHQMYLSVATRHVKQKNFVAAKASLFAGCVQLLKASQVSSGSDLAKYLLDVYVQSETRVSDASVSPLLSICAAFPEPSKQKDDWMRDVLSGKDVANEVAVNGVADPILSHLMAYIWQQDEKYEKAASHYIGGIGDSARNLGNMLPEWATYSEAEDKIDMEVAQMSHLLYAVMQFMAKDQLKMAQTCLDTYLQIAKKNGVAVLSTVPCGDQTVEVLAHPILIFLRLMTLAAERGDKTTYLALQSQYAESVRLFLPDADELFTTLGEIYFGIKRPAAPMNMADILSSMFGGAPSRGAINVDKVLSAFPLQSSAQHLEDDIKVTKLKEELKKLRECEILLKNSLKPASTRTVDVQTAVDHVAPPPDYLSMFEKYTDPVIPRKPTQMQPSDKNMEVSVEESSEVEICFVAEPADIVFDTFRIGEQVELEFKVRNISKNTRRLRQVLPSVNSSTFQVTPVSDSTTLSRIPSGLSRKYIVRYTATSYVKQSFEIKLAGDLGDFIAIPVRAELECPCFELPQVFDLGYINATKKKFTKAFEIRNTSANPVFCVLASNEVAELSTKAFDDLSRQKRAASGIFTLTCDSIHFTFDVAIPETMHKSREYNASFAILYRNAEFQIVNVTAVIENCCVVLKDTFGNDMETCLIGPQIIGRTTKVDVAVVNESNSPIDVFWNVAPDYVFKITPERFKIDQNGSSIVSVTFTPEMVSSYSATMICCDDEMRELATMTLSGEGIVLPVKIDDKKFPAVVNVGSSELVDFTVGIDQEYSASGSVEFSTSSSSLSVVASTQKFRVESGQSIILSATLIGRHPSTPNSFVDVTARLMLDDASVHVVPFQTKVLLPDGALIIKQSMDSLGDVEVGMSVEFSFTLSNTLNVPLYYKIMSLPTVTFAPSNGLLDGLSEITVVAVFCPQEAGMFKNEIKASVGTEDMTFYPCTKSISVDAKCVVPFIKPSVSVVDLGECYPGHSKSVSVSLSNVTGIATHFEFDSIITSQAQIEISPSQGLIPGNSVLTVDLTFLAAECGIYDSLQLPYKTWASSDNPPSLHNLTTFARVANFSYRWFKDTQIITESQNMQTGAVLRSESPATPSHMHDHVLDFGKCQLFARVTRTLTLQNMSAMQMPFLISFKTYAVDETGRDTKPAASHLGFKSQAGQKYIQERTANYKFTQENQSHLTSSKGAAFYATCGPSNDVLTTGLLEPNATLNVSISLVTDNWGGFEDEMTLSFAPDDLQRSTKPWAQTTFQLKAHVTGGPLAFEGFYNQSNGDTTSTTFELTRDITNARISKEVTVWNRSSVPVVVQWSAYTEDPLGSTHILHTTIDTRQYMKTGKVDVKVNTSNKRVLGANGPFVVEPRQCIIGARERVKLSITFESTSTSSEIIHGGLSGVLGRVSARGGMIEWLAPKSESFATAETYEAGPCVLELTGITKI